MILSELIENISLKIKESGSPSARLDAEILVAHLLKIERSELITKSDLEASQEFSDNVLELVERRCQGEPVAYILGYKDFYKSRFVVSPDVLIPRPETELSVELALDCLKKKDYQRPIRIIDFGTGSGCLGLSVFSELNEAELLLVDMSAKALKVAQKNCQELIEKPNNCFFLEKDVAQLMPSDLPSQWSGKCDLILANPPYVAIESEHIEENVKKFEPEIALFSKSKGLEHIELWAERAAALLEVGGQMIFEIGDDQKKSAFDIVANLEPLDQIEIRHDYSNSPRIIFATKVREWTQ